MTLFLVNSVLSVEEGSNSRYFCANTQNKEEKTGKSL